MTDYKKVFSEILEEQAREEERYNVERDIMEKYKAYHQAYYGVPISSSAEANFRNAVEFSKERDIFR